MAKQEVFLTDRAKREKISREVQKQDAEYYKYAVPAMERSKGASEAMRKYQLAKRDYAKASLLGKIYLKLTGQANFKKMLEKENFEKMKEEANRRSR